MFDNEFNPKFESVFRTFFLIWVSGWGVVNILTLLFSYVALSNAGNLRGSELGLWWVQALGNVTSIACGIVLLFIMTGVPTRIKQAKRITNIGLMTGLSVVYYLFLTTSDIFAHAIFNPSGFSGEFVRLTAWLLPSIAILVFHQAYFANLRAHNAEVATLSK